MRKRPTNKLVTLLITALSLTVLMGARAAIAQPPDAKAQHEHRGAGDNHQDMDRRSMMHSQMMQQMRACMESMPDKDMPSEGSTPDGNGAEMRQQMLARMEACMTQMESDGMPGMMRRHDGMMKSNGGMMKKETSDTNPGEQQ